jgi:hypothetical protein
VIGARRSRGMAGSNVHMVTEAFSFFGDHHSGWIRGPCRCALRRLYVISGLILLASFVTCCGPDPAGATRPTIPVVPCTDSIGVTQHPAISGYRLVLGRISVPPDYNPQVIPVSGHGEWKYWRKAGVAVQRGSITVTVRVPPGWRSRVAITWGGLPIVSALRFSGCGLSTSAGAWNAYAGGFYLRASRACVPLTFSSRGRENTLWFGLGKHCSVTPQSD